MKPHVLLADEDGERRTAVAGALRSADYRVSLHAETGKGLMDAVRLLQPDVVVIEAGAADRDALEHMCCLARELPRPVVMFTHDDDAERMRAAIRAGVSAYVVGDIAGDRVKHIVDVAVMRFEEHQVLRRELEQAKTSLAERKLIERAKGILMRQRGCEEAEAYRALRKLAMDRNRRLADVAQTVIEAANLLG